MLLMIDNYDSFTYNLVQYFGELKVDVQVYRNDEITIKEIKKLQPEYLVISPGPCTPNQAGISIEAIRYFTGVLPILGVCLGHQSIAQAFGGKIIHAKEIMHGKISEIHHNGDGVFKNIYSPLDATRYHSLVLDANTLPNYLEVTAWTELEGGSMDEIMGVRHKHYPIEGIQFHPESILTQHGHAMLKNFLDYRK